MKAVEYNRNRRMESKPIPVKLVTVKEFAEITQVPVSWIYDRTRQGQEAIPHINFGKYVRFDLEEVIAHFRKEPSGSRS